MRTCTKLAALGVLMSSVCLVSCSDDNGYARVASVGRAGTSHTASGSGGTSAGTSGSGGSGTSTGSNGILVAGGNVLVGAASQFSSLTGGLNGLLPVNGVVNGTITAILGNSGHTLVELGNGTSVLLNGTGGGLGDTLRLNLANGTVVGGPVGSPLIGVNVLAANPTTGTLATVNAASGNQLVGVTVLNSALGGGGSPGTILIAPALAGALGLNANGSVMGSLVH